MKKIIAQVIIIILILVCMINTVNAASFKFSATPSKTTVKPGEEIEITLAVSDIDLGGNGMNTIEGFIKYDTNVFEKITSADVTSLNSWAVTYNDENTDLNGKFLGIILSGGVKENQNVAKIKLKVKENIESQPTQITISKIATNDGTNLVEEADKTINIKIEKPQTPQIPDDGNNDDENNGNNGGNTGNAGTNAGDNNQGTDNNNGNTGNNGQAGTENNGNTGNSGNNGSTGNGSNNGTSSDKTTKNDSKLPQTGEYTIYITLTIAVIALISIVTFIKYKKYNV